MRVLQNLPWDKVDIQVVVVELEHVGKVFTGTREDAHQILINNGFDYVGTLYEDDIFVRKDLNVEGKFKIETSLELIREEFPSFGFFEDGWEDECGKEEL